MSSHGWIPKLVPLGRGEHDETTTNLGDPGVTSSVNAEYGIHGGVRGRPGLVRTTGFGRRDISALNAPTDTAVGTLAATGYAPVAMFPVRDSLGERPGLLTRGRMWTYEGARWQDRLGCNPASYTRLADTGRVGDSPGTGVTSVPVTARSFSVTNNNTFRFFDLQGGLETETASPTVPAVGVGAGAICGSTEAVVWNEPATANLRMAIRPAGSYVPTIITLRTDSNGSVGYGDAPSICCDFGETVFFVVYATNVAHTFRILRVSTAGTVLTNQAVTVTNNVNGLWCTNTAPGTNKLVVAVTDSTAGTILQVYNSTTLATASIDTSLGNTSPLQNGTIAVVGAAANGVCWYAYMATNTFNSQTGGLLTIGNRSLTAATKQDYWGVQGYQQAPNGIVDADQRACYYIRHQPITVNGRVLLGIDAIRQWHSVAQDGVENQSSTWYVYDITDLHAVNAALGNVYEPVLVAKGPWGGSQVPWCASAAMLTANNDLQFQTVDWTAFRAKTALSSTAVGNGSTAKSKYSVTIPSAGIAGLNRITNVDPQTAHSGDSTVISGSAPRQVAGGNCVPVGFPFLGGPAIRFTTIAGGSPAITASQYSVTACWRWVDDRGQIHRSAPAPIITTVGPGTVTGSSKLVIEATNPMISERDLSPMFVEFYCADVGGAGPLFKQGEVQVVAAPGTLPGTSSFTITLIDTTGEPLYTTGGILQKEPIDASGGVATLGKRLWVSDGRNLFGGLLGSALGGDGPAFNSDGPLVVELPPAGGRVRALATIDDRVIALCSRGIYATAGTGPDDTGGGPDFAIPSRMGEVACAGQRSVVSTPRGVIFIVDGVNGAGDPLAGGPWILGRDGNFTALASRIQNQFDPTFSGQCAWLPEREWFVWANQGLLLVWDIRTDNWSVWQAGSGGLDFPTIVGAAGGLLWGTGAEPAVFSGAAGTDVDSGSHNVLLQVTTNAVPVGDDRLGWGKVRAFKVLGEVLGTVAHTIAVQAIADDLLTVCNTSFNYTAVFPATWPTNRYAPEFRCTTSKASTVIFVLQATPGAVQWDAIELQTRPLGGRAPAGQRA